MNILFGELQKKLFSYNFIDSNGSRKISIVHKAVSASFKKGLCIKRPHFVWILLSTKDEGAEVMDTIIHLDSALFSELLPSIILQIRSYQENKTTDEMFTEMVLNLLQDRRLGTQDILDIASIPSVRKIIVTLGAALPPQRRREIATSYGIENQWLSCETAIADDLYQVTKFLLSDREAEYWKTKRQQLLTAIDEERKAREAELEAHAMHLKRQEEHLRNIIGSRGILKLPADIEISDEYLEAIRMIKSEAKTIFITGDPGTGKSTLIQLLKTILLDNIAVLSFTGTAALQIGGQTINSFFQMPFHILPLTWTNPSRSFIHRAQALQRLIIDEVSMLRPDMLDAISSSLSFARKDERPFGGVQLILFGDLYQLPPVLADDKAVKEYYEKTYQGIRFFFASKAIQKSTLKVITLKKMFRTNQPEYLQFLSKIRNASAHGEDLDHFNRIIHGYPEFSESDSFVQVTPFREAANRMNRIKLEKLEGTTQTFEATVEGKALLNRPMHTLHDVFPGDFKLHLKPKAQVMFIKNDKGKKWVNGDLGIVEEIKETSLSITTRTGQHVVEKEVWPVIKYTIDPQTHALAPQEIGHISQFPVRLAWAITIHKVQGQTFDALQIDFTGGVFDSGMAYVALSRCRTMEGLRLTKNLVQADIIADNAVVKFMNALPDAGIGI